MLFHCQRGDEFISGEIYHVNSSEAGGAAVLGGIASTVLAPGEKLELPLDSLRQAIKPDNVHGINWVGRSSEPNQSGKKSDNAYFHFHVSFPHAFV